MDRLNKMQNDEKQQHNIRQENLCIKLLFLQQWTATVFKQGGWNILDCGQKMKWLI